LKVLGFICLVIGLVLLKAVIFLLYVYLRNPDAYAYYASQYPLMSKFGDAVDWVTDCFESCRYSRDQSKTTSLTDSLTKQPKRRLEKRPIIQSYSELEKEHNGVSWKDDDSYVNVLVRTSSASASDRHSADVELPSMPVGERVSYVQRQRHGVNLGLHSRVRVVQRAPRLD